MRCAIFVSDKLAGVPIVECGGIFLAPGDELVVRADQVNQIKNHYGAKIIHAGETDVDQLSGGHYHLRTKVRSTTPIFHADPKHQNEPAGAPISEVENVAADKSMIGKKARKK